MPAKYFGHYDPFIAESLAMGYRIKGAGSADRAAAAKKMSDAGLENQLIALRLDCSKREVCRYIYQWEVAPLPPIAEWTQQQWPLCRRGHEKSPDNVNRVGQCKICRSTRLS